MCFFKKPGPGGGGGGGGGGGQPAAGQPAKLDTVRIKNKGPESRNLQLRNKSMLQNELSILKILKLLFSCCIKMSGTVT